MPETSPRLVVSRVARRFGRRRVLRDVSFAGYAGEIIGLLGPNGSGKTTLLGVLSTLAEPSAGAVAFPSDGGASPRRHLGVLGHEPQLYGELTARENLELFARLCGLTAPHVAAERALEHARLLERADEPVERFSRGMRQRLAFERVLMHDPTVLLLDEPFTGLDEESVRRMVERLVTLRASGVLTILATHDLALVDDLLDRAFVVVQGVLVAVPRDTPLPDAYRRALASTELRPERRGVVDVPATADRSDAAIGDVIRAAWVLFVKDLRVEWRSREGWLTTAFFALACVLVFSFGLVRNGAPAPDAGPAVLWVTLALAGTLAMGRTFERERAAGTLMAVLASPAPRAAIYLGKWAALITLMAAVEAVLVPLVALFFQLPLDRHPLTIAGLLLGGTVGYAAVGTLFASMLARTRTRDVLLPLLLYPMTVPVLIAGVRGTSAALADPYAPDVVGMWLRLLVSFDAVFVTLALWTFGAVMTEAAPRVAPPAAHGAGHED